MCTISWCLVVLHKQAILDKIVFGYLYFVAYSHLHIFVEFSCFSRGIGVRIFHFCVRIGLYKPALSSTAKSDILINTAFRPTLSIVQACTKIYTSNQTRANYSAQA
jgi:hypothetical protein